MNEDTFKGMFRNEYFYCFDSNSTRVCSKVVVILVATAAAAVVVVVVVVVVVAVVVVVVAVVAVVAAAAVVTLQIKISAVSVFLEANHHSIITHLITLDKTTIK